MFEPPRAVPARRPQPTSVESDEWPAGYQDGRKLCDVSDEFGLHRDTISAVLQLAGSLGENHQRRQVDLARADELRALGSVHY